MVWLDEAEFQAKIAYQKKGAKKVIGTDIVAPWVQDFAKNNSNKNRNNGFKERTACGAGHEYVEGSWYADKKQDNTRRCRICKRNFERERRKRLTPEQRERVRVNDRARRAGLSTEEFMKKSKLDYIKMTPAQSKASDELNWSIDKMKSKPACRIPVVVERDGKFVDSFPHIDYDERIPPTMVEAMKMCMGCEVLEKCAKFAQELKPKTGVWGGEVYVDGKVTY